MLIIEGQIERRLTQRLETTRDAIHAGYCVYFPYPFTADAMNARHAELVQHVQHHLQDSSAQLFLCEDGEAYLHTPRATLKEIRTLLGILPNSLVATQPAIYELNLQLNPLLLALDQKLQRRKEAAEQALAEKNRLAKMQRREQLLELPSLANDAISRIPRVRAEHRRPEIMIIEDDMFSRRLVEKLLPEHCHLTQLESAEHALMDYIRIAPDMLLLDINLPDVTGHELLQRIFSVDPQAYVIMLSGSCDRQNVMQAMQNGAQGFLAKPFSREKIHHYVNRCPAIAKGMHA